MDNAEHIHDWNWAFDGEDWDKGDFMQCWECGAVREIGKRERLELISELARQI